MIMTTGTADKDREVHRLAQIRRGHHLRHTNRIGATHKEDSQEVHFVLHQEARAIIQDTVDLRAQD